MNHTTRCHPRTLNKAFGPYAGNQINEDRLYNLADKLIIGLSFVVVFLVPIALWFEVL